MDFETDKIEACITAMRKNAPGIDGWSIEFLEEIFYVDKEWFIEILNHCLKLGIFPNCWKVADLVFIPNDGKDPSECGSYRPVCLLPVWGKILDKLMTNRLTYYLDENYILNEAQFGFRKERSSISALARVKDFVECAKEENKISCMVSFDIQNAFNSIKWAEIKKQLVSYNVQRN
ncbi:RNA-directed DNA polymerase from mobile element jockey [Araneus ventricosus]|uniref:RNA-directed DNA polymerase from mobile element jockey n=1 Tax=Araneus ventricosus TaxID=182803 RepID=A0A4Y2AMA6_ARAVE|nr:RNA-directed DNA polymerase from mobile element jockey [Araneus ventricosus]